MCKISEKSIKIELEHNGMQLAQTHVQYVWMQTRTIQLKHYGKKQQPGCKHSSLLKNPLR